MRVFVLTSQEFDEMGFQLHGVHTSIAAAVDHVAKDADLGPIRKQRLLDEWTAAEANLNGFDGNKLTTNQIGLYGKTEMWVATVYHLNLPGVL